VYFTIDPKSLWFIYYSGFQPIAMAYKYVII